MTNKKRSFSLRKLIYNDKYLIVCSILLAVIIWVATSMNLSPETTKKITVPVTIDFTDTLAGQLGIEYFGNKDITVEVKVSCKKYLAKDISDDDINASLQISTVTSTGYHSVPVLVTANDESDFSIESYFPTSVEGYYDIASETKKPVEIRFVDDDFLEDGYVLGTTTLSENSVTIKGPKTYVDSVDKVIADVQFDNKLSEPQVVELKPKAVDLTGREVSYVNVTAAENSLTATIPVLKVVNLQTTVNLLNAPANAEDLLDITYSVPTIQVGILKSSNITSAVIGDVDYTRLGSGTNVFTFDASKVNGFTVLDGTTNIEVTITPK